MLFLERARQKGAPHGSGCDLQVLGASLLLPDQKGHKVGRDEGEGDQDEDGSKDHIPDGLKLLHLQAGHPAITADCRDARAQRTEQSNAVQ